VTPEARRQLARLGAPAAFLLAFTIFVLIIRSGTQDEEAANTVRVATQATTRAAPATTRAATTAPAATTEELYEIQQGDTLETVAQAHGTTVEALLELNPGIDPTTLSIGQQIRVR
jgi:LysM repeat protein